jgi:hypothetical protein
MDPKDRAYLLRRLRAFYEPDKLKAVFNAADPVQKTRHLGRVLIAFLPATVARRRHCPARPGGVSWRYFSAEQLISFLAGVIKRAALGAPCSRA